MTQNVRRTRVTDTVSQLVKLCYVLVAELSCAAKTEGNRFESHMGHASLLIINAEQKNAQLSYSMITFSS